MAGQTQNLRFLVLLIIDTSLIHTVDDFSDQETVSLKQYRYLMVRLFSLKKSTRSKHHTVDDFHEQETIIFFAYTAQDYGWLSFL